MVRPTVLLCLALLSVDACRRGENRTALAPAAVQAPRPAAGDSSPPRGTLLALLYSSNLRGEYEPCG